MNERNLQFRELAANSKYPFTEDSSYTSTKGIKVPWSVFLDIIIYPDIELQSNVYISEIYKADTFPVIVFKTGEAEWFAEVDVNNLYRGTYILNKAGRIIGTIVISEAGGLFIEGMVAKEKIRFYIDSLIVLPENIMPVPSPDIKVYIEDELVERYDIPLEADFQDERFTKEEDPVETDSIVHLDNTVRIDDVPSIIETINGIPVKNRPVYLSTNKESNLQIVPTEEGILFHRRGD